MLTNQQIFFAILLVFITYIIYNHLINKEHFESGEGEIVSVDSTTKPVTDNSIKITEYYTEDGGITVAWNRPNETVDYMAIIKDEQGEEIKMFFKDTIDADCQNTQCRYSFQNLKNGNKYSLVLSTVSKDGISGFSNEITFTPTYQTMKCNANGTCSVVKSVKSMEMDTKLNDIIFNTDTTKEVLAKCQTMIDDKEHIYDINQIYEADGGFKSVKDKLQYPEHLLLPIKKGPDSLAELVKHQLELGIVNINVHNQTQANNLT